DERAVKVLEHQVEWVPEDTRARIILANAYATQARPSEAVRELERVLALGPTDPHTVYNVACTYALLLRKQESLAVLRKAVEAGYSEADPASRDPDLAILHGEPEFERLLEQMKREE
ncbi:MAG TPA: tetratricopeptide repeat protein, partial [Vicinamibacteria bacterium]|nr:tetratricopeptide repeat protein [Vicinamibacteria bacterium]